MTRYFGKVCEKHPELKGERLKSNSHCVFCHRETTKQYRHTERGRQSRRGIKYGTICLKHPELGGRKYGNGTCTECHKEISTAASGATRDRLKKEVFTAYGGKCTVCGETDIDVLNIDHIDDDGCAHRKELPGKGTGGFMYKWLKQQRFPEGFQVLCANCNLKKQVTKARKLRRSK